MGFGAAQILSGATQLSELGIDVDKSWESFQIHDLGIPVDPADAVTLGVVNSLLLNIPDPTEDHHAANKEYVDDGLLLTILQSVLTTHGDILYRGASEAERLAPNAGAGKNYLRSAGEDNAPEWKDITNISFAAITFVIDGGGAAITDGEKGHLVVPFTGTIIAAELEAGQSGSIVVDVWKNTYANFPPAVADSICSADKPTISATNKWRQDDMSDWNPAVDLGDVLAFNVDSCTTITRATLTLYVEKT